MTDLDSQLYTRERRSPRSSVGLAMEKIKSTLTPQLKDSVVSATRFRMINKFILSCPGRYYLVINSTAYSQLSWTVKLQDGIYVS